MARCPECGKSLSAEDTSLVMCPACGCELIMVPPELSADSDSEPVAASAEELDAELAGQTMELTNLPPEDVARMQKVWRGVMDANTEQGMTIKANQDEELPAVAGENFAQGPGGTVGFSQPQDTDNRPGSEPEQPADSAQGPSRHDSATGGGSRTQEDAALSDDAGTIDVDELRDSELGDSEKTMSSDEIVDAFGPQTPPDEGVDDSGDSVDENGATLISDEFVPLPGGGPVIDDGSTDGNEQTYTSDPFDDAGVDSDGATVQFDSGSVDPGALEGDTHGSISGENDPGDADVGDSAETLISDHFAQPPEESFGAVKQGTEDLAGGQRDDDDLGKTVESQDFLSDDAATYASDEMGQGKTDPLGGAAGSARAGQVASESDLVIRQSVIAGAGFQWHAPTDYEIQKILGEGGMGTVELAKQTSLDREVAVKKLKVNPKKLKEQQEKFLTEAVITGELGHPNIVPIYDVGCDQENALFYSMKRVTGRPWSETLTANSLEDNIETLLRVADAVAFAHSKGIVHRDLKPENVMLGEFGEVLVMDWGLALPLPSFKSKKGVKRSSSMGGTPAYMAPEMAVGPLKKVTQASDVYLLGAILYEIITKRPPHRAKNAMQCLMAAARNEIHPTTEQGELVDIALKAMSKEPGDRHASAHEFKEDVENYLRHAESFELAYRSAGDLEDAEQTKSYQTFNKALFGYEEALRLWDGNEDAEYGLAATRVSYAQAALTKHDYELAESVLQPDEPDHKPLLATIAKAKQERDGRERRLKTARRMGVALLATVLVVSLGAAVWINEERTKAVAARDDAEEQRGIADKERIKAEEQEAIAVKAKNRVEGLLTAEQLARQEAVRQTKLADDARIAAVDAQKLAETERKKAEDAAEKERLAKLEVEKSNTLLARSLADEEAARKEADRQQALAQLSAFNNELAQFAAEKSEREAVAARNRAEKLNSDLVAKTAEEIKQRKNAEMQRMKALEQEKIAIAARDEVSKTLVLEQKARREADHQQALAELSAFNNELAQFAAEKSEREAVIARKRAEKLNTDLVAKTAEEIEQRKIAQAQRAEAVRQKKEAERQTLIALDAKEQEEREAYVAIIGLAKAKIDENAFVAAENLLEDTNAKFRSWEWGYLKHLCSQSAQAIKEPGRLESIALFHDGDTRFVVVGADGVARIRRRGANAKQPDNNKPDQVLPVDESIDVFAVAVSPDNRFIALGTNDFRNGLIKLYDVDQKILVDRNFGQPVVSAAGDSYDERLKENHLDSITSLAFSKDGQRLLSAALDNTARIWNVSTGEQQFLLLKHSGPVREAIFVSTAAERETRVVTVSQDGTAIVWQDPTGNWQSEQDVSFLTPFRGHNGPVLAAASSPDGQFLATAGVDRQILVWQPANIPQISQSQYYELLFNKQEIPRTPFVTLSGHDAAVSSVQFAESASEGELVLVSGGHDHLVKVWRLDREDSSGDVSALKTFKGHGGWVRDCVLAPNGRWILSVGHDEYTREWSIDKDASSEVFVFDGTPLQGHGDAIGDVAIAANTEGKGLTVATVSSDKTIKLWPLTSSGAAAVDENQQKKQPITMAEGHNDGPVPDGLFLPGDRKFFTAGGDSSVRMWDVLSGTEQLRLKGTGLDGVFSAIVTDAADGQPQCWVLTAMDKPTDARNYDAGGKPAPATKSGDANSQQGPGWTIDQPPRQARLWLINPDDKAGKYSPVATFGEHRGQLTSVAVLQDATDANFLKLLTADSRGNAFLWRYNKTSKQVTQVRELLLNEQHAHEGRITSVKFLQNGSRCLIAGEDRTASVWNLETGREIESLRMSHSGSVISISLSADELRLATLTRDNEVTLWNLESAKRLASTTVNGRLATVLANLKRELSSANKYPNSVLDKAWRLVNANAADDQYRLRGGWKPAVTELLLELPATVSGEDDPARVLADRLANRVFSEISADELLYANLSVVGLSRDGKFLAAGNVTDNAVHLWTANTNGNLGDEQYLEMSNHQPQGLVFSQKEGQDTLAVLSLSGAELFTVQAGETASAALVVEPLISFRAHDQIVSADFDPTGQMLLASGREGSARIWDTKTGQAIVKLDGGKQAHTAAVNQAVYSPDGTRVLTVSDDSTAKLWKIESQTIKNPMTNSDEVTRQAEVLQTFRGHKAEVTDGAFTADGRRVVTVSSDGSLRVWEADTGKQIAMATHSPDGNSDAVLCVAVCADGERIVTGSRDQTAIIWQMQTNADTQELTLKPILLLTGHAAAVTDVAFSPHEDLDNDNVRDEDEPVGVRVVTASDDNSVILWDTRTPDIQETEATPFGKQVLALRRHKRGVTSVRFSPNGRYVLSGSQDTQAILWPTADWYGEKLERINEDAAKAKAAAAANVSTGGESPVANVK